jgi:hypothetical protein
MSKERHITYCVWDRGCAPQHSPRLEYSNVIWRRSCFGIGHWIYACRVAFSMQVDASRAPLHFARWTTRQCRNSRRSPFIAYHVPPLCFRRGPLIYAAILGLLQRDACWRLRRPIYYLIITIVRKEADTM